MKNSKRTFSKLLQERLDKANLPRKMSAEEERRLSKLHRIGIYWFGRDQGFRSIGQAWEHLWWTESTWQRGNPKIVSSGYSVTGLSANMRRVISPFRAWIDQYRQSIVWKLNKGRYVDQ